MDSFDLGVIEGMEKIAIGPDFVEKRLQGAARPRLRKFIQRVERKLPPGLPGDIGRWRYASSSLRDKKRLVSANMARLKLEQL